jgi:ribose transport system substrate-binding protein
MALRRGQKSLWRFSSFGRIAVLAAGMLIAVDLGSSKVQAACEPHKIDVGDGKLITGGCDPLKIAFIGAGSNNTYMQSNIQSSKETAEKLGGSVDFFDPNWTTTVQYNQAQNVLAGGKYNGIIGGVLDGVQMCKILTEDAPGKNILVSVYNQALCGRALNEGEALWAPGTLDYIGGAQSCSAFTEYFEFMAKQNPGPQKVLVLSGPDLNANSLATDCAVKAIQAKHPEFKILSVTRTNYTVVDGNQKTLPLLQANPDTTILFGNYSEITRGAVQAIKQAGIADKVKVYDAGGSAWAYQAVKDGNIAATKTYIPYTELKLTVESMFDAWKGKKVDRYIPLPSVFVTKENIAEHHAEY